MRRPRPKFKDSLYLYFCCFWINVTQINFKNIKRKIQRIISDTCFQLKSWFNVDARAPSIPLLNFPFKVIIFYQVHLICLWPWLNHNSCNLSRRRRKKKLSLGSRNNLPRIKKIVALSWKTTCTFTGTALSFKICARQLLWIYTMWSLK